MSDWMTMTAAELSPGEAFEQYCHATNTPEIVHGPVRRIEGGTSQQQWNLFAVFMAGVEYADASR